MDTVIVGEYFRQDALQRALVDRIQPSESLQPPYHVHQPQFLHSDEVFPFSKHQMQLKYPDKEAVACNTSIVWFLGMKELSHILVNGRRQGASPKSHPLSAKQRYFSY
jgi:hypothetical protein